MEEYDLISKKISLRITARNATKKQRTILEKCEYYLEWVMNHPEWRNAILYHVADGSYKYLQTDKTNQELLESFIKGDERDRGNIDYEADINIKFYFKRFSRVLGYVNSNGIVIHINTKYWPRSIPSLCGTIIHELSHLYGGTHSYKRSDKWPLTAPYAYGNIAQKMILAKMRAEKPEEYIQTTIRQPRVSLWMRIKKWFRGR